MDGITIPDGLLWIVIGISVLVQFLREFESVEKLKRFIPYLCIVMGAVAVKVFGDYAIAECVQLGVAIGLMAAGGYDAIAAFSIDKKLAALDNDFADLVKTTLTDTPKTNGTPAEEAKTASPPALPLLPLLIGLMLFAAGCAEPLFTAQQRLHLAQSSIIVTELDTRCQGGDDVACREGLSRAAETLRILTQEGAD